jgi:hypothetical protein
MTTIIYLDVFVPKSFSDRRSGFHGLLESKCEQWKEAGIDSPAMAEYLTSD